jgi:hypothetical protein
MTVLQPKEKTLGHAEVPGQSQVKLSIDRPNAIDHFRDAVGRNANGFRHDSHFESMRLEEFSEQHLSRVLILEPFRVSGSR